MSPLFCDSEIYDPEDNEMIFVDLTEIREESRLALGDVKVQPVVDLESITGADIMISGLSMPATSEKLIMKHIEAKALLVQRKHRMDLVASIGNRLKKSIGKMRATGARQSQCVLLFIGVLTCDRDGKACIDGQPANRPYWSVNAGMSVWTKYGGVIEPPLSKASLIPEWLKMKERHVKETISLPVKEFIPSPDSIYVIDPDDPLQELIMVSDWRQTAICCPGWGQKKVNALHHALTEVNHGDPVTLIQAMTWMGEEKLGTTIPGVGKGLVKKARDWMGLDDGRILTSIRSFTEEEIEMIKEM